MAAKTEVTDIKVDVAGKRIPRFKAGAELSGTVNAVYIDTNEGSQDGGDYEYTVTFNVTSLISE
jgi:hypothetical protein